MSMTVDDSMNRDRFFRLLNGFSSGDLITVQNAYYLAKESHREQRRDDGKRYFDHARDVAVTIIQHGRFRNVNGVVKSLVHDVVEDTRVPPHLLVGLFGQEIWRSLNFLSKYVPLHDPVNGALIGRYKKPPEVYFAELRKASEEDRAIKVANRLSNMRTMQVWSKPRQIKYAEEARDHILPIADETDSILAQELRTEIDKALAN